MAKFPTSVRVGYRTYKIEKFDILEATSVDRFGECDHVRRLIKVRMDMDSAKSANTMLHEVIHACWYISGMEDEDKQERVVNGIANQLTQVWRDNPVWAAWMTAALSEPDNGG